MTFATIGEVVVFLPTERRLRVIGTACEPTGRVRLCVLALDGAAEPPDWVAAEQCRTADAGDGPVG